MRDPHSRNSGYSPPDGILELDQKLTVTPGRVKVRVESVEVQEPPKGDLIDSSSELSGNWKRPGTNHE